METNKNASNYFHYSNLSPSTVPQLQALREREREKQAKQQKQQVRKKNGNSIF